MINCNNAPDHKLTNILQHRYQVYHLLFLTDPNCRDFLTFPQLFQKKEKDTDFLFDISLVSFRTLVEMPGMVSQLLLLRTCGWM